VSALDVSRSREINTRIARELHDIVSHSLSVVITLADAAVLVNRSNSDRGTEAMADVSEVGRHALSDMRAMLGLLRTEDLGPDLAPPPGIAQVASLVDRIRATGLEVEFEVVGDPFDIGAAAELTTYRVVQEALTNTIRHAEASRVKVSILYDDPEVHVLVEDDGAVSRQKSLPGHGIEGMRERAALHGGTVFAGPGRDGGWSVSMALRLDRPVAKAQVAV
jgi:signal transduction histidine kinase